MINLRTTGRRWMVLNYVVSEPGKWTCRAIAEDLEDNFHGITEAMVFLSKKKGLVEKGKKVGRSFTYSPTPAGVELLQHSLGK